MKVGYLGPKPFDGNVMSSLLERLIWHQLSSFSQRRKDNNDLKLNRLQTEPSLDSVTFYLSKLGDFP